MVSDADDVIGIYQRHALAWSADRGQCLAESTWLDRFLALLPPEPAVLDIGCGAGVPIGRYLVDNGCRVTGVDASRAMIEMCVSRFPAHEWHVADMRTLALERTFDGLLVWDSLFHLPPADQRRVVPILKRHAAPGTVLMFTSGPSAGEKIGSYRGERLYHASLDSREYRTLLAGNGFDVVAHVSEDPDCGLRSVWLAKRR